MLTQDSILTEEERLQALFFWAGVVSFAAIWYLTGGFLKAAIIAIFVWISAWLGFGRRWILRGAFAIAVLALAVAFGVPHPDQWMQLAHDAR